MVLAAIGFKLVKSSHRVVRLSKTFLCTALGRPKMKILPAVPNASNLVWIDLEMTGLDLKKDKIIEVACLITGPNLEESVEGPHVVLGCSDEILDGMDDWCKTTHGNSGLTSQVKKSTATVEQVEQELLDFVSKYCPPGKCPLAGSSVHCDKEFLTAYMPRFVSFLHYRIVDVSTVKELVRRWYPDVFSTVPPKGQTHRAMEDIRESIAELQWYRKHVFRAE